LHRKDVVHEGKKIIYSINNTLLANGKKKRKRKKKKKSTMVIVILEITKTIEASIEADIEAVTASYICL
jgi:hypothetical protein